VNTLFYRAVDNIESVQLVLDGCSNLGDTELYLLAKEMGQMCEICMRGTNIRYISELEMNKVKVDN
jgi:hypothetical protein